MYLVVEGFSRSFMGEDPIDFPCVKVPSYVYYVDDIEHELVKYMSNHMDLSMYIYNLNSKKPNYYLTNKLDDFTELIESPEIEQFLKYSSKISYIIEAYNKLPAIHIEFLDNDFCGYFRDVFDIYFNQLSDNERLNLVSDINKLKKFITDFGIKAMELRHIGDPISRNLDNLYDEVYNPDISIDYFKDLVNKSKIEIAPLEELTVVKKDITLEDSESIIVYNGIDSIKTKII